MSVFLWVINVIKTHRLSPVNADAAGDDQTDYNDSRDDDDNVQRFWSDQDF